MIQWTWLKPLQEWVETDGLGGFSSSTTSGIHEKVPRMVFLGKTRQVACPFQDRGRIGPRQMGMSSTCIPLHPSRMGVPTFCLSPAFRFRFQARDVCPEGDIHGLDAQNSQFS